VKLPASATGRAVSKYSRVGPVAQVADSPGRQYGEISSRETCTLGNWRPSDRIGKYRIVKLLLLYWILYGSSRCPRLVNM
jgi:hypothetical protein